MSELRELLAAGSIMLTELSAIFNNLVRFQLNHWILWLGQIVSVYYLQCFGPAATGRQHLNEFGLS